MHSERCSKRSGTLARCGRGAAGAGEGLVLGAMQGLYLFNPNNIGAKPLAEVKTSKVRRFLQLNVLEAIGQLITICGPSDGDARRPTPVAAPTPLVHRARH